MTGLLSNKRTVGALSILAIVVIFFAANIFAAASFRHARLDLTEDSLFTLSPGTINILENLDESISLKLYYSESIGTEIPQVHKTAERFRDIVSEFSTRSGGKLNFDVIPVERYSETEDEASELGLSGAQAGNGEIIYFGFVATNAVDGREVVPFVPLDREQYMEYDLISMIYRLDRVNLPVLGLITSLPLDTGPGGVQAAMQGMSRPYVVYDQLLASFEVEHIDGASGAIPEEVDVLLIAHPDVLSRRMLYAIDQFVMKGGRVLALLDPFSEMSQQGMPQMQGQPSATVDSSTTALAPLLESWGVTMIADQVVADGDLGFFIPNSGYPPMLLWPRFDRTGIDEQDLVTANLGTLQFASAGSLLAKEGASTSFTPLVTSSVNSSLVPFQDVKFRRPPEDILRGFSPDETAHVLAARILGPVSSAFPEGTPTEEDYSEETGTEPRLTQPHAMSAEAANIIIIADADFIDDRFWVRVDEFLGERLIQKTTDNGDFLISAVENLMGSNDLISLRARASSGRPFTLVQDIQRSAEERFLPKQEELEQKLIQISARIDELRGNAMAVGSEPSGDTILVTQEQRTELKALVDQHDATRKEQRQIQYNLRADIDRLGNQVRFINVAMMPLLVAFFALCLAFLRSRKRRGGMN